MQSPLSQVSLSTSSWVLRRRRQFGGCVRALLYLVSPLRRIESPTPATASIQLPLASSHVFMPPIIHPTLRQLHPTKVSMELRYID
ncbi:unnamed protein product [Brassica oleracea]